MKSFCDSELLPRRLVTNISTETHHTHTHTHKLLNNKIIKKQLMVTKFNPTMHAYNPESNSMQLYGVISVCSITCVLSPSQSMLT